MGVRKEEAQDIITCFAADEMNLLDKLVTTLEVDNVENAAVIVAILLVFKTKGRHASRKKHSL